MTAARKPLQGTLNVARFNWPFYLGAGVAAGVAAVSIRLAPKPWSTLARLGLLAGGLATVNSLLATYYVYDASGYYELGWLDGIAEAPGRILNVNAGFDELTASLRERYAGAEVVPVDFYDPDTHTEASIARARAAYPPPPDTVVLGKPAHVSQLAPCDLIVAALSAHEIRDEAERIDFFERPTGAAAAGRTRRRRRARPRSGQRAGLLRGRRPLPYASRLAADLRGGGPARPSRAPTHAPPPGHHPGAVTAVEALQVAGGLQVALALAHVIFPRYFRWREELPRLSLVNAEMMRVHTLFVALTVAGIGALSLGWSEAVVGTAFGRVFAKAVCIFWAVRWAVQFVGYSSELWRGKGFETGMHVLFVLLWTGLVAVYAWAGW